MQAKLERAPLKAIILTLIISNMVFGLDAQNLVGKGKLLLRVSPLNAIVKIDSKKVNSKPGIMSLDSGWHYIEMWAPTRVLLIDSIYIKADTLNRYTKVLPVTESYLAYRKEAVSFKAKRTATNLLIPVIGVVYYPLVVNPKINDYNNQLKTLQDQAQGIATEYENLTFVGTFEAYKKEYKELVQQYNSTLEERDKYIEKQYYIYGAAALLEIGVIIWTANWNKPKFVEETLLSNVALKTGHVLQNPTLGLTLKF